VQQESKVELMVNLKTAKALGLAVPQSILLRADKMIEWVAMSARSQELLSPPHCR
jgi:hypothetical protein